MVQANQAKLFLGLNADFSIVSGLFLLAFSQFAANTLFTAPENGHRWVLLAIGAGCLIFAAMLVWFVRSKNLSRQTVMSIVWADVAWVLASAVLLVMYTNLFTATGLWITAGVAGLVGVFAIGQTLGAKNIRDYDGDVSVDVMDKTLVVTLTQPVNAAAETVWEVMNDHPGYAGVADNISKVEVVSGTGMGMVRRCYGSKGESWTETCDRFESEKLFGFTVHTEAPDYPYPFSLLQGEWAIQTFDERSGFSITITVIPKGNRVARWLFRMIAVPKFTAVLLNLGEAWARRMEELDPCKLQKASCIGL